MDAGLRGRGVLSAAVEVAFSRQGLHRPHPPTWLRGSGDRTAAFNHQPRARLLLASFVSHSRPRMAVQGISWGDSGSPFALPHCIVSGSPDSRSGRGVDASSLPDETCAFLSWLPWASPMEMVLQSPFPTGRPGLTPGLWDPTRSRGSTMPAPRVPARHWWLQVLLCPGHRPPPPPPPGLSLRMRPSSSQSPSVQEEPRRPGLRLVLTLSPQSPAGSQCLVAARGAGRRSAPSPPRGEAAGSGPAHRLQL